MRKHHLIAVSKTLPARACNAYADGTLSGLVQVKKCNKGKLAVGNPG